MNLSNISIVPYDPSWPGAYSQEVAQLTGALGTVIAATHHIGSTTIINMPAKAVIDILIELADIRDFDTIAQPLSEIGYTITPNIIPHFSRFARREEGELAYHLHIFAQGDPQVRRHVNFRNYMNAHPAEAKAYAELKFQLATRYHNDRQAYTLAKNDFIQSIDAKAKHWSGRTANFLPENP